MINLFLIIIITIYSNLLNATGVPEEEAKLNFVVGKYLYANKEYRKAYIYFDQVIVQVRPLHKLSEKSKIYKIMIHEQLKNTENALNDIYYFVNSNRYSDYIEYVYYFYSSLVYNNNKKKRSILVLKHHKRDISIITETLDLIQHAKVKYIRDLIDVVKNTSMLMREYNKNRIYIMKWFLKKNDYYTVLARLKHDFNFRRVDDILIKYIFLNVKCCNELFIENVGKNIEFNFRRRLN